MQSMEVKLLYKVGVEYYRTKPLFTTTVVNSHLYDEITVAESGH